MREFIMANNALRIYVIGLNHIGYIPYTYRS